MELSKNLFFKLETLLSRCLVSVSVFTWVRPDARLVSSHWSVILCNASDWSGEACWELYGLEHGISPDGTVSEEMKDMGNDAFYNETGRGKYVPRYWPLIGQCHADL